VDTDHDLLDGKGVPIESWTLKEDSTFTLPDGTESREYPKGTWMMGVKFADEPWERIKDGDLSGFSIYGEAAEHSVDELLGQDVDLELDSSTSAAVAAAKEADSTDTPMSELPSDREKELGADELATLAEHLNAYFEEAGGDVETASLQDLFEWAAGAPTEELPDTVEIGGVELPIRAPEEDDDEESDDAEGSEEESSEGEAPEDTEEQSMDDTTEDGTDGEAEAGKDEEGGESSTQDLLEEVRDTVKSTQESVEKHGDRIEALEEEVFEKEDTEDSTGEDEATEADPEELKEEAEQAAAAEAEKQVKDLLGIEELPDDPEERQEVVRKHFHEQTTEEEKAANPDDWGEDEVQEVVK